MRHFFCLLAFLLLCLSTAKIAPRLARGWERPGTALVKETSGNIPQMTHHPSQRLMIRHASHKTMTDLPTIITQQVVRPGQAVKVLMTST